MVGIRSGAHPISCSPAIMAHDTQSDCPRINAWRKAAPAAMPFVRRAETAADNLSQATFCGQIRTGNVFVMTGRGSGSWRELHWLQNLQPDAFILAMLTAVLPGEAGQARIRCARQGRETWNSHS